MQKDYKNEFGPTYIDRNVFDVGIPYSEICITLLQYGICPQGRAT